MKNKNDEIIAMPVKQFLKEIRPMINAAVYVQGFVITVRTEKSMLQMKWGSNRIVKFLSPIKKQSQKSIDTNAG